MILNFMKNKYIFILFFILSFTYDIFSQNHFHEIYDTCFYSNHLHNLSKGGNQKRYKYIKSLIDTSNEISLITESVDWLGLYKNIIV